MPLRYPTEGAKSQHPAGTAKVRGECRSAGSKDSLLYSMTKYAERMTALKSVERQHVRPAHSTNLNEFGDPSKDR